MNDVLTYPLFAAAFIAVVLGIEGLWRLLRSGLGEERAVTRRLAKARGRTAAEPAAASKRGQDPVSLALAARLPWLQRALLQSNAGFGAVQLLVGASALFLAVLVLLSIAHAPQLIALTAALALGAGAPVLLVTSMVKRRRKRFLDQLPQAVDLMARSLQAGHPVTTAMSVVGQRMADPLGPEFRITIAEMSYGLDRDEAFANLLRRFPVPELRMFTASLEVTRESGGNLAEVFLKLAAAIRAKDHLRRKVEAISAEGRMTFWVVSALPFLVSGALLLLRPGFFTEVAGDRLFWPMMSCAPTSLAIGTTIIWRMVNVKI